MKNIFLKSLVVGSLLSTKLLAIDATFNITSTVEPFINIVATDAGESNHGGTFIQTSDVTDGVFTTNGGDITFSPTIAESSSDSYLISNLNASTNTSSVYTVEAISSAMSTGESITARVQAIGDLGADTTLTNAGPIPIFNSTDNTSQLEIIVQGSSAAGTRTGSITMSYEKQ